MEKDLVELQKKYGKEIEAKKNVVGTGIGLRWRKGKLTNEVCFVVFVKEKVSVAALEERDVIPSEIEGVSTDVQVRQAVAMVDRKARWRPAPGGVSVGHPNVTAGTLTIPCLQEGIIVGLSNNHVIANNDEAKIGDPIYQPGVVDGGTSEDEIGTLIDFEPISNGIPNMDAAIFRFQNEKDAKFELLEIGALQPGLVEAYLGQRCRKSGRTTGVTNVIVTVVHAIVKVSYGHGRVVTLVDQIIADKAPGESRAIQGGDSGSAMVNESNQLVGLCFAGAYNGDFLIANRIKLVADRFKLDFSLPPSLPLASYRIGARFKEKQGCLCAGFAFIHNLFRRKLK